MIHFAGAMWCPFHLPFAKGEADSGKRDWDADSIAAFADAVMAFVNMSVASGVPVDLTGVCFPGETSFEAYAAPAGPLPAVLFDCAYFVGDVDFIEVRFAGPVSFANAVFDGDADFIVADFADRVSFQGAVFHRTFDASEARFHGAADFTKCDFKGPLYLRETQFYKAPVFDFAVFSERPVLDRIALPEGGAFPFPVDA